MSSEALPSLVDRQLGVDQSTGEIGSASEDVGVGFVQWLVSLGLSPAGVSTALDRLEEVASSSLKNSLTCAGSALPSSLLSAAVDLAEIDSFERVVSAALRVSCADCRPSLVKSAFEMATGKRAVCRGGESAEAWERRGRVLSVLATALSRETQRLFAPDFFDFSGVRPGCAASLEVCSETVLDDRWPSSYAVSLWWWSPVRPVPASGEKEPRLVCFVNSADVGLEVFFLAKDGSLVVRTAKGHELVVPETSADRLAPCCWHHLVVEHHQKQLGLIKGHSRVSVFVDGVAKLSDAKLRFPSQSGILAQRTLGNISQRCVSPGRGGSARSSAYQFRGRLASVVLMHSGALGPHEATSIFERGPGFDVTTPWLRSLRCSMTVDFVLSPRCCTDARCLNADRGTATIISVATAIRTLGASVIKDQRSIYATFVGAVRPVHVISLPAAFHTAVGPACLLPLFHFRQLRLRGRSSLETAARLLRAALDVGPEAASEFHSHKGFTVLTLLLQGDLPKEAVTEAAIESLIKLSTATDRSEDEVAGPMFSSVLFNFSFWSRAPSSLQHRLASALLDVVSADPSHARRVVGMNPVFRALRQYNHSDETGSATTNRDDVAIIRSVLIKVVALLFWAAGDTLQQADVGHLVSYLHDAQDSQDLQEVCQGLAIPLLQRPVPSFLRHLDSLGNVCTFLHLLSKPMQQLRHSSITMLGLYLSHLDSRSRERFLSEFSILAVRDALEPFPVSDGTYVHLCRVLTLHYGDVMPAFKPREPLASWIDSTPKGPPVRDILHLTCSLTVSEISRAENKEATEPISAMLRDLEQAVSSCPKFRECFLEFKSWQTWPLEIIAQLREMRMKLGDVVGDDTALLSSAGVASLNNPLQAATTSLFSIIATLLRHSMQKDEGWRPVEELTVMLEKQNRGQLILSFFDVALEGFAAFGKESTPATSNLSSGLARAWKNYVSVAGLLEVRTRQAVEGHVSVYEHLCVVRRALLVFDELWTSEAVRQVAATAIDGFVGKRRLQHMVVLRLSLLLLRRFRVSLIPNRDPQIVRMVHRECSRRMASVAQWAVSAFPGRDAAVLCSWMVWHLLKALKAPVEGKDEEVAGTVFQALVSVISVAKNSVEGLSRTLKFASCSQALLAAGSEGDKGYSSVEEFVKNWYHPWFIERGENEASLRELREISDEYKGQSRELYTAAANRKEAVLSSSATEVARRREAREVRHALFCKEAFRDMSLKEEAMRARARTEAFSRNSTLQGATSWWRRVVRNSCCDSGTWPYHVGRSVYQLSGDATAEDPALVKELLWRVDSVETVTRSRPFLKLDFTGDPKPREEKQETDARGQASKQSTDMEELSSRLPASKLKLSSEGDRETLEESGDWCMMDESEPPASSSSALVEELPNVGEPFLFTAQCTRVSLFVNTPGLLCLTQNRLFFFKEHDTDGSHGFKCWPLRNICALFNRRHTGASAMEIFTSSKGKGYLFSFKKKGVRTQLAFRIVTATAQLSGSPGSASPQLDLGSPGVEYVADPVKALRKGGWTGAWQRREISNFHYLTLLNSLAGRSFNDLAQYFVFPWVLSDYLSQELDLYDTGVYRDLSKPVGALNPTRLEAILKRYHDMPTNTEGGAPPPFMYGSHYSAVGSVLFWLLRLEPFSAVARELQGGTFDYADRLFCSMSSAWSNCLTSTSDVKELLPEFYYLPDLLRNVNSYWFGRRQNGTAVGDVVLPDWAGGSPEKFSRILAEALESDEVSSHLHEWIDLIFGYKQRGPKAVEANNVFYYLTYLSDIDSAMLEDDSPETVALRTQLAYFGQTPTQLFKSPHPQRDPGPAQHQKGGEEIISRCGGTCETRVDKNFDTEPVLAAPVGPVLVTLGRDGMLTVHSPAQQERFVTGAAGETSRVLIPFVTPPVATHPSYQSHIVGTARWKTSVLVVSVVGSGTVQQVVDVRFLGSVTCASFSLGGLTFVIGGTLGLSALFDVSGSSAPSASGLGVTTPSIITAGGPRCVLRGHAGVVTCALVAEDLDVCATGCVDGSVCIFHAKDGQPLRTLPACPTAVRSLDITSSCDLVVSYEQHGSLFLYTVNGRLVEEVVLGTNPVLAVKIIPGQGVPPDDVIMAADADGITVLSSQLHRVPRSRNRGHMLLPQNVLEGCSLRAVVDTERTASGLSLSVLLAKTPPTAKLQALLVTIRF